MAYIEKRGQGRWRVRWRDPDGELQGRTFTREDEAKRFRARVEGDLVSGGYVDPERSRTTVAAFAGTWRESVVDLRPSTLARLDATVNTHVLPEFGQWPLAAVGNADVRGWAALLRASGLSSSSVRKAVFALRRILAAAVADRRLAVNPAENVPLPGEDHGEQRFLTPDEVATLADAVPPRYRALVLLACYGGLRFGELAGLRRSRIDLVRGRITVAETLVEVGGSLSFGPPKTRNGRRGVPIPRSLVDVLAEHMDAYCDADAAALVFTSPQGRPLRRVLFRRRQWQPAVRAAGLEPLTFHELRHTYVSMCAAAGLDLYEVSKRAGHSSAAFTADRYRHLYEDADDAYAERLDAVFGAARATASAPVVPLRKSGG